MNFICFGQRFGLEHVEHCTNDLVPRARQVTSSFLLTCIDNVLVSLYVEQEGDNLRLSSRDGIGKYLLIDNPHSNKIVSDTIDVI